MSSQRPTSNVPYLPDDVVLRVSGVSKKFCRNLRRSMWYGIQDLAGNLLGKTLDSRPETIDSGGEAASQESLMSKVQRPMSDSDGLTSKVQSLKVPALPDDVVLGVGCHRMGVAGASCSRWPVVPVHLGDMHLLDK